MHIARWNRPGSQDSILQNCIYAILHKGLKKKSERKRLVVPGVGEYRERLEYKGTVQGYFGGDKTILFGSEVVDIWLQIDQKPVCYRANVLE